MSRKAPNPYPPKNVEKPPPPPPPQPKRVLAEDIQISKKTKFIIKETIWAAIPIFVGLKVGFMTWPYLSEEHKILVGRVHDSILILFKIMWQCLN